MVVRLFRKRSRFHIDGSMFFGQEDSSPSVHFLRCMVLFVVLIKRHGQLSNRKIQDEEVGIRLMIFARPEPIKHGLLVRWTTCLPQVTRHEIAVGEAVVGSKGIPEYIKINHTPCVRQSGRTITYSASRTWTFLC